MSLLTLSLGSNQQADHHIRAALDALQADYGTLQISSVFESRAVGFDGNNFLNMVVAVDTDMALATVSARIKALETEHGRVRGGPRFSPRTLDIDILTYADCVGDYDGIVLPRPEITENAFVLWPMSQLCGDLTDPHTGLSYATLWQRYDKSRQVLWPIDFDWQGRRISSAVDA
ncbi:2-amino-4-hydroxy-6-hydroxymethyldihydropteridine diphosphokinase [Pseudohongiella acticola]|jgi:2-amino-4-hydroxy-6-hydroxymethyldihydropteridine diphosphokinase|uniref:2-amino-4-hydroxy-6- hydroxymethyldihydropteridine diphosphokinase n=1 Tax=Pseudohongiella acticola TaxID=1524254 RepID=UPI0030EEF3B3